MIPYGTNLEVRNIPVVTAALIVINTITFYVIYIYFGDVDAMPFTSYLVTLFSFFLHADFYHLFGNMLFLWVFGSFLEDRIGSSRFLLYYFICEIGASLLHTVVDGRPSIGASGAIAGVMGIYLCRFHYSKIKTVVPIFFFKININAKWLLLLWLIRDVYDAFYTADNVAHWAHIGGFLTGIIIGIINSYWSKAEVEHLYERATDCIRKQWGLTEAEEDLIKVLKIDPYNAEANLELARYFSECKEKREKGKKYYLAAARAYYLKNNIRAGAGEVFLEYLDTYKENMSRVLHLKYAASLADACNYQGALRILEPLLDTDDLQGSNGERVIFNYIEYALKAGLSDSAQYAYDKLRESHPDSLLVKKAESLIRSYKPVFKKSIEINRTTGLSKTERVIKEIKEIASDSLFKVLIVVTFGLLALFDDLVDVVLFFPLAAVLSFVMTYLIKKQTSFLGGIYAGLNRTEDERLREYNANYFMNKATVCEREENYDDAIEYLKAVTEEEKDIEKLLEVRYRIAKLYHEKLNQPEKAISEYKILSNIAPKGHPFKRDAYNGIKELSQLNPSPAV